MSYEHCDEHDLESTNGCPRCDFEECVALRESNRHVVRAVEGRIAELVVERDAALAEVAERKKQLVVANQMVADLLQREEELKATNARLAARRKRVVDCRFCRRAHDPTEPCLRGGSVVPASPPTKLDLDEEAEEALREAFPGHGKLPDGKEAMELRQAYEALVMDLDALDYFEAAGQLSDRLRLFRQLVEDEIDCRDSNIAEEKEATAGGARASFRQSLMAARGRALEALIEHHGGRPR